ncbi:spore gernimation protein GerPD [Tepidibacillus fermentans]|uniref:Spore germination protein PD n=1 Tax=Tepidibacillus fermentans TaxID=1281767 RepID=A0A4R3K944_9BACI|nr:spore gernimation protein GerPD [Tepidibacillus fermentans]TCS79419.1 spore germination protein PD [Tepidibacillus fermentans]
MKFHVINHNLFVGNIKVIGITSSAVFLIGDTHYITASSIYDTPPEAVTFLPLVRL